MPPRKFNFDVALRQDLQLGSLQIGAKLEIERQEAGNEILVKTEGVELGSLPSGALDDYHPLVKFEGFVRSVMRSEGAVNRICVCVTPCKRKREGIPRWEQETVDEEWLLKPQHYEALVANFEIQTLLKNEKLRKALQGIDESDDKETALHEAHGGSEDVKQFIALLLGTIHNTS